MMLEEMQDRENAATAARVAATRAKIEKLAREGGSKTMAALAKAEKHKPKRINNGPSQMAVPEVTEKRNRMAALIESHDGITGSEIRAQIPGANANDFGQLRAQGRIHAVRAGVGAPRATLYYAGPAE